MLKSGLRERCYFGGSGKGVFGSLLQVDFAIAATIC